MPKACYRPWVSAVLPGGQADALPEERYCDLVIVPVARQAWSRALAMLMPVGLLLLVQADLRILR